MVGNLHRTANCAYNKIGVNHEHSDRVRQGFGCVPIWNHAMAYRQETRWARDTNGQQLHAAADLSQLAGDTAAL